MTREQLKERFPHASDAFLDRNCDRPEGIRSDDTKRTEGHALERPCPREKKSRTRVTVHFVVYSLRPADWDGWHIKELQDCLIHAGILDGDEWDVLEGHVTSEKVHTKDEERTEITILNAAYPVLRDNP